MKNNELINKWKKFAHVAIVLYVYYVTGSSFFIREVCFYF